MPASLLCRVLPLDACRSALSHQWRCRQGCLWGQKYLSLPQAWDGLAPGHQQEINKSAPGASFFWLSWVPRSQKKGPGNWHDDYWRPRGQLQGQQVIFMVNMYWSCVCREVLYHSSLCHPHIVQFREVFLSPTHLALVMEYVPGGDLYDYCMWVLKLIFEEPHLTLCLPYKWAGSV